MAADENTSDCVALVVTKAATTVPEESASWITVPADTVESRATWTPDWVEVLPGVTTIPALPAAATVPPVTASSPLTSSAPLPLFVGPLTITVPPEMDALPLESRPSPWALIVSRPPVTSTV